MDCPGGNPYGYDEYNIGQTLKDAAVDRDYKAMQTVFKKPIFSFLDNEIVKNVKILAMNPPQVSQVSTGGANHGGQDATQKALDNLLL